MNIDDARQSVVRAGKRLVTSGLIARTWGNVSCRISESYFVITPSGRDYMSLTPDEIVTTAIADCSYSGNIKPSSERGVHADVYKQHPEINFVIHTHQDGASVVSALGLESIKSSVDSTLLGNEVVCAEYGLPGTRKLRRSVADALKCSSGNAVIMKNHGALCFGKDDEEAFKVASELERACDGYLSELYLNKSGKRDYDPDQMRTFALSKLTQTPDLGMSEPYYDSERTKYGFKLRANNGTSIDVTFGQLKSSLPREAEIYNEVYLRHKKINYIIHADTPNISAVSGTKLTLYPLLDDFAQIVGTSVKSVMNDPLQIASALKKASAVFIHNSGALCCGASQGDAAAAAIVMEKNCKALIGGALFGRLKPINRLECKLMRFVYLKKYSKQGSFEGKKSPSTLNDRD